MIEYALCVYVKWRGKSLRNIFVYQKVLSRPSSTCRMESNDHHSADQAEFVSSWRLHSLPHMYTAIFCPMHLPVTVCACISLSLSVCVWVWARVSVCVLYVYCVWECAVCGVCGVCFILIHLQTEVRPVAFILWAQVKTSLWHAVWPIPNTALPTY